MVLFRKKKESAGSRIVQLTIVQGNNETDDGPGKVFSLQSGNNFIGREPACEVVLNSGTVSRKHANIRVNYDKTKYSIIDLGSVNGTAVKPSTILKGNKKDLASGDEIQIGELLLKFLVIDEDESLKTMSVDDMERFVELWQQGETEQDPTSELKRE